VPERIAAAIKMADRVAAFFEATQLAGFTLLEANRHFGMPRSVPERLRERLDALDAISVAAAQAQFLSRFNELHES
jgi:5'-deoxynucleotidase YfbR-like HD superfamily hydrolase